MTNIPDRNHSAPDSAAEDPGKYYLEDTRFIECSCNCEEMPADEARWQTQCYTWMENIENNEAIYKCPDCGELVTSECELVKKEII